MDTVIAVFSSRSETLYFYNLLKSVGIYSSIINTPKAAGQACGISVRFTANVLPEVKNLFSKKSFRSFKGFYGVTYNGGREQAVKL